MNSEQFRALQAPLKAKYRENATSGQVILRSSGVIDRDRFTCTIDAAQGRVVSGLHETAGGDGQGVCSGEMLLDALVACAGVTLSAVATAMDVPLRSARIHAEGDWDVRGTLGVSREAPVGVSEIRLSFEIDTDAETAVVEKLIQLTERYCVILQTLKTPPRIVARRAEASPKADT